MALLEERHIIRGMSKDVSESKFNSELAFDALNVRITSRDDDTSLLSITNERGTEVKLLPEPIKGYVLGHCVLNDNLVIFTTEIGVDYIYLIVHKDNHTFEYKLLYDGANKENKDKSLGFSPRYPIETLGIYENEDILKVYWLDGINQPRFINIKDKNLNKAHKTYFDFVPTLELNEECSVERHPSPLGSFHSGTIQYVMTYYNKYGQESNIFYKSSLLNISNSDRGAAPDDIVNNSFTIRLENIDIRFNFIRIYSIHRTSIDGTPIVKKVKDILIDNKKTISYTDTGTTGESIDSTILLYIGGEEISFKTFAQKDNTLFLGNAELKRDIIPNEVRYKLRQPNKISWDTRNILNKGGQLGYYSYINQLPLKDVKGFKYLEWYRFGILFQHYTGKWSEPLFIGDKYNGGKGSKTPYIGYNSNIINVPTAHFIVPQEVIDSMKNLGYKKMRGVVVFPSNSDREVIALGIVCPTLYNVGDRFSNSPFTQSSWFSRPSLQYDIDYHKDSNSPLYYRRKFTLNQNSYTKDGKIYEDIVNYGAWAEFRDDHPIPNNWERNSEIQCLVGVPEHPYLKRGSDVKSWVADNKEYYFVDQSIVTFHSPDIEFNEDLKNIDGSKLKFRIIGAVRMGANASEIDIRTNKPPFNVTSPGFTKEFIGSSLINGHATKSLLGGAFWVDYSVTDESEEGYYNNFTSSYIYPWHSEENLGKRVGDDSKKESMAKIETKKISNLKFANHTEYFSSNKIWTPELGFYNGITPVSIYDSELFNTIRIPSPENSGLPEMFYAGNVDKLLTITRSNSKYSFPVRINFNNEDIPSFEYDEITKRDGYIKVSAGVAFGDKEFDAHRAFTHPLVAMRWFDEGNKTSYEPVRIKYKTTPHAVFSFNYNKNKNKCILPTMYEFVLNDLKIPVNAVTSNPVDSYPFWNSGILYNVALDVIDISSEYGVLWLGELYRDNVENRFGGSPATGSSEEVFTLNEWVVAGDAVALDKGVINYTSGDTYFQRYDCLKTYSDDLELLNSVTEIVSFMVESRINIDGRYDRNRGLINNLVMTPKNFNLLNDAYSLKDNYFIYRGVNPNDFRLNNFPNTISWTKEKFAAEEIDTWTNITMASALELDGDKGPVESLNTFNNEIFCFQKTGLSNIIFNPRVLIPSSDGVPIEISNSMKVLGKRYISNTIGCSNKWSIVESPAGLYFMDNITNSIYLFNQLIKSISDELGFRNWVSKFDSYLSWNPKDFNNIRSYYDKNNNDVYFVTKDECLGYSELLQSFTSFYSYERVPAMFNINSEFFSINRGQLWLNFAGEYNRFYNSVLPYYITIISNLFPNRNKIYSTVDFRASVYDLYNVEKKDTGELPFNYIEVNNEYLEGKDYLEMKVGYPSNVKRKFRVWRVNIPRDNSEGRRTRISNTWTYITLGNDKPSNKKMEFHDMEVKYML